MSGTGPSCSSLALRHEQIEQLLAGVDAELLIDVARMGLRRALGDDELAGHAGQRLALGEQLQHLALARREAAAGGYFGAAVGKAAALVFFGGADRKSVV